AAAGARITVTDLSLAQLAENRRRTTEAGLDGAVADWRIADIRDLSAWGDGAFDLVLAYGGAISYVFADAAAAVTELLRVTRLGGLVLASVMSTLGTYRHKMRGVVDVIEQHGDHINDAVLHTGDLRAIPTATHVCRMFTAAQLPPLVTRAGGRVTAMSASNWASLADPKTLARLESVPERWEHFLDNETWICRQPGKLDGGIHILFAAEHRNQRQLTAPIEGRDDHC
ncbi:MAG: class I SAM-dependent methyltransferase, partial [Sciscionella sp.]